MFERIKQDTRTKARLGRVTTPHGVIQTPVFMPVGTQASVKALDPRELLEMGTQIVLGNTYHLFIRPGLEVMQAAGGLHAFMNWSLPILTDSGGFQIFSLARIRKLREDGVEFRSHLDGAPFFLGPREAMEIQRILGSDIAMVLDECPPQPSPPEVLRRAVERTLSWARLCREQDRRKGQQIFGIVQGGSDPKWREYCARELVAMDFDGYAIGGLSVGEPVTEVLKAVELTEPFLPEGKARYAMGLGTPAQMVELIARGVDMFDCVLPTRVARNGTAFTWKGTVSIKAGFNKQDFRPIEEDCECYACRNFSRAYLRHLLNVGEILGLRMVSVHNSHMFLKLMETVRQHLAEGTFHEFRQKFVSEYVPSKNLRSSGLVA